MDERQGVSIRPFRDADAPALWRALEPAIRAGETYALPRDMGRAEAVAAWTGPGRRCFVAAMGGEVVGAYYLRPNHGGGGAHVANCGYVTAPAARGRGVAGAMCAHSLRTAAEQGFAAMQFNLVVASNAVAVRLWRRHGFAVVGRIPGGFRHPTLGEVDALVMHRFLDGCAGAGLPPPPPGATLRP